MDVVIDNFKGSRSLGIDVTCVDVRNLQYFKLRSPMAPGTCASDAEQAKIEKYTDIYSRQGHEFVPFAVESFDAFGPRTVSVFNRLIAHVYAANVHMPLSFIKQYWRNRIVMAMQVSASKGLKVRMDSFAKRRDTFFLPFFTTFLFLLGIWKFLGSCWFRKRSQIDDKKGNLFWKSVLFI